MLTVLFLRRLTAVAIAATVSSQSLRVLSSCAVFPSFTMVPIAWKWTSCRTIQICNTNTMGALVYTSSCRAVSSENVWSRSWMSRLALGSRGSENEKGKFNHTVESWGIYSSSPHCPQTWQLYVACSRKKGKFTSHVNLTCIAYQNEKIVNTIWWLWSCCLYWTAGVRLGAM